MNALAHQKKFRSVEHISIQDELLDNRIPYPRNFDGKEWHSYQYYSRKSLPSYLRKQLPLKRFRKIKEKFQSMNKFAPPEITYFENMIKPKKNRNSQKLGGCREKFKGLKQKESHRQTLREDFQYSMIMTSPQSKVLIDLLEKAEAQRNTDFGCRLLSSKERRSRSKSRKSCFENTGGIVFGLKKRQLQVQLSRITSLDLKEEVKDRINSIRLLNHS